MTRATPPRTWLNDLQLLIGYWEADGGRTYHHTAPINAIYGLHEALAAVFEEGLEASVARHLRLHLALGAGLEAMGLTLPVAPAHRLAPLNVVGVPDGVDEGRVRGSMLERFGVEIGSGLGPWRGRVWRIGLMGASCTPRHIRLCLTALSDALEGEGVRAPLGEALAAVEAAL